MKMHDLKCWPVYFCAIKAGVKTFDVRKDDRGYQAGDVLNLREYLDPSYPYPGEAHPTADEATRKHVESLRYTGDSLVAVVTYLLRLDEVPGLDPTRGNDSVDGWVVLGLKVVQG